MLRISLLWICFKNPGFLLCEEDKTNPLSLAYWFRIVDLNGDGIITPDEMLVFYTEQVHFPLGRLAAVAAAVVVGSSARVCRAVTPSRCNVWRT